MINFNTIVVNLFDIADVVRKLSDEKHCQVEALDRDQIRYEDGAMIRLMNEIVSQLQIDRDVASEYDYISRDYRQIAGNKIPTDRVIAIYSEFYRIIESKLKELAGECMKKQEDKMD